MSDMMLKDSVLSAQSRRPNITPPLLTILGVRFSRLLAQSGPNFLFVGINYYREFLSYRAIILFGIELSLFSLKKDVRYA